MSTPSNPAPPTFLLIGYYGHGLAGDEAILSVLTRDLWARWPGARLVATSVRPEATAAAYGVECIRLDDIGTVARAIDDADVVIVGGGGLFTEYGPFQPLSSLRETIPFNTLCTQAPLIARARGRACVIFSAGVETLVSQAAKDAVRAAFETATFASVRDSTSLAALAQLGEPQIDVLHTCDPAATLQPARLDRDKELALAGLDPSRPVLTLSLRHWDATPQRLSTDPQPWEDALAQALKTFCADTGCQLLAVPHHLEPGWAYSDDRPLYDRLFAAAGAPAAVWGGGVAPRGVAAAQALGDAHLAMRHHGVIFSTATQTPCAALAYSRKVRGAMTDAGLGDYVLDLSGLEGGAVGDLLRRLFADRKAIAARLADNTRRVLAAHEAALGRVAAAAAQPVAWASRPDRFLAGTAFAWLTAGADRTTPQIEQDAVTAIVRTFIDRQNPPADLAEPLRLLCARWPDAAGLQYYLGFVELLQGEAGAAIRALTAAIEGGYAKGYALSFRAEARFALNDLEGAEEDVAAALAEDPSLDARCREILSGIKGRREALRASAFITPPATDA
jgi:polysaccharide pyruvyl transferase WcaK-like protein